ncbi:ubiquitin-specific protease doa4 [Actinomortierella ambigua]|nr:ubiquitin-specific protease doa4 [Actinomortierella ambigua]
MLPTMLDDPRKRLKALADKAMVEYEPRWSVAQYSRSAQNIIKTGHLFYKDGNREAAYVNYLKAIHIVLQTVQQSEDFEKQKHSTEYQHVRMVVVDEILPKVESMKIELEAEYRAMQEIEAEALETAAKVSKPQPPPRPSKPAFLSSGNFDKPSPATAGVPNAHTPPTAPAVITLPTSPPDSNPASQRSSPDLSGNMYSEPLPTTSAAIIGNHPNLTTITSVPLSSAPLMSTSLIQGSLTTPAASPPPPSMIPLRPTTSPGMPLNQNGHVLSHLNMPTATSSSQLLVSTSQPQASPAPPVPARRSPAPDSRAGVNGLASNNSRRNSTSSSILSSTSSSGTKVAPISITAERLKQYMCQVDPPRILFFDIRAQAQFDSARIRTPFIINIEPIALRDGVSSRQIAEQGLFNRPDSERSLFQERKYVELVVYYDQMTTEVPRSGPLYNLVQALWDTEYEPAERTKRKPVLLEGGMQAWLDVAGITWVEGTAADKARQAFPTAIDPSSLPNGQQRAVSPQNYAIYGKVSQGGGINRHDGKIISRDIGEYIRAGDNPQSMINPRTSEGNTYRPAYPPSATPYSNLAHRPYGDAPLVLLNGPPVVIGQGGDKQEISGETFTIPTRMEGLFTAPTPSGPMAAYQQQTQQQQQQQQYQQYQQLPQQPIHPQTDSEVKLQRRVTIYDNHWNNFGTMERNSQASTMTMEGPTIYQIQNLHPGAALVPGVGSSAGGMTGGVMTASGPSLQPPPRPPPPIPSKRPGTPMRPLPQPPGMSDLKSYTQFGSGFSKIGSQLGKAGLTNLGNTCFMNSVIQCLIATPPLTRFFLDGSYKLNINLTNVMGTKGKVAEAFADLIRNMWSGQSLVISPTSFRQAIIEFAPQFKGTEQHDSQEFLSFLLDGLHEDLKRVNKVSSMVEQSRQRLLLRGGEPEEGSEADEARMESLPEWEASEIAWQRYLARGNSIVVSLFQGQYKNRLSCSKCGKTSTTYNPFMYLTLPIKAKSSKPQTLQSCLDAFTEPEVMEGENAWHCPRCKKPRKAIKQLTISRLPDVLLIQLKRFASDGPFKNKIKAKVEYPISKLDLTKYLPPRPPMPNVPPPPPIRIVDPGSGGVMTMALPPPLPPPPPVSSSALYDLYAVSNHSGEVSNGHYTACVRGESQERWTNFDDTRVSPCDKSVAVSEHGYTLFYVRGH